MSSDASIPSQPGAGGQPPPNPFAAPTYPGGAEASPATWSPYSPTGQQPASAQPTPWDSQQPAGPWTQPAVPSQPAPWGAQPGQSPYAPSPYASSAYAPMMPQQQRKKSPLLGVIGCVGVVVFGVAFSFAYYNAGLVLGPDFHPDYMTDEDQRAVIPVVIVGFLGLCAWVVSIVATATDRGRAWGIVGIVLGVLAPIIGALMGGLAMMP